MVAGQREGVTFLLTFIKIFCMLQEIIIKNFQNSAGTVQRISLTYETYGPGLGTAPIVLVTHALTGNSRVTGKDGWWSEVVGAGKSIDTDVYTVICFNIPGNGFDGKPENLVHNYTEFTLHDISRIFSEGLERLGVQRLFAAIGGSIGGALVWELGVLRPDLIQHLIPVATDYKATDWLLALCRVQDQILNNSVSPVSDAREHAMTFYRSPQSLQAKFNREKNEGTTVFKVHSWLSHHGNKLENRFSLPAYKLMNHLLMTVDISRGTGKFLEAANSTKGHIHIVTVDSDLFFVPGENRESHAALLRVRDNVSIHEITSLHGHDAFLIENDQLNQILNPIFNNETEDHEKNKHRTVWNR